MSENDTFQILLSVKYSEKDCHIYEPDYNSLIIDLVLYRFLNTVVFSKFGTRYL